MIIRIIFILFLCQIASPLFALECSVCKQQIKENSNYLKSASGEIFCSKKCSETKLPNCDLCGQKSKNYLSVGGKNYCSKECAANAGPHCSVCNNALFGVKFLKSEKALFCSEACYLTTTPKCVLCSQKSMDRHKIIGKDFCGKCVKLPTCDGCKLPSNGNKHADGREICKSCEIDGVQNEEKAKEIYLNVKSILATKFKIETTEGLALTLINKDELFKIKGSATPTERGFYRQKESQNFKKILDDKGNEISKEKVSTTIDDRHIFILSFLPVNHFRNVVAHELTHNWQMTQYPQLDNKLIEEGLAEYVAYLLNVDEKDTDLIKQKMDNKDPVYGDGFRFVKEWDKGKGIDDIKAKLKELYGPAK
jgi:hypothetical protein